MSLHDQAAADLAAIAACDFDRAEHERGEETIGTIAAQVAADVQPDHFGRTVRTPTLARVTVAGDQELRAKDIIAPTTGPYAGQRYVIAHMESRGALRVYAARLEQERPA